MDIKNLITYLKEELKDIPANPDNVHLTDFEGLYYILQGGLKGQKGGYRIHSPKTREDDMEVATTRNTHKLTDEEKKSLSPGASGGIRINLFTDRILAGHRGTRKTPIAELPLNRKGNIERGEYSFKKLYGIEIPKLYNKNENHFKGETEYEDFELIRQWIRKNIYKKLDPEEKQKLAKEIYYYNKDLYEYNKELIEREREERFLIKNPIPTKPEFMSIVIEKDPNDMDGFDKDFVDEVYRNYLTLLQRKKDVFVQNNNYRKFKNYLRDKLRGNK